MAEGVAPGRAKAETFFTDCPPGCDPAARLRWGVFVQERLSVWSKFRLGFRNLTMPIWGF